MIKKGWSPLHGIICLWSGTLEDIPDGWVLCDGQNGTPDLSARFVRSATPEVPPHQTGGSYQHTHELTIQPASPSLETGDKFINSEPDGHYMEQTYEHNHTLTIDTVGHHPLWYSLAYIMKL